MQRERQTKVQMKIVDNSLLFDEKSTKWTKTPKGVQSRGNPNIFLSLVTTRVKSRHSCKISRECFKFLKINIKTK